MAGDLEHSELEDDAELGVMPGFEVESVVGLREASAVALHFGLLRGLTSGTRNDFLLRFGAVSDLVHSDQTAFSHDALERRLVWMAPEHRDAVLRGLRKTGWLEPAGPGGGFRLSSEALAVYATLCRLASLRVGRDDDMALGVFDLEASTRLKEDTGPALRHLSHHLRRSIEDVESAIKSQSELKVLEARDRLDKNLEWSRRARSLLDAIDIDDEQGYRSGQRLGRELGELHRWHSVMQRALDEVGRTRLPLGAAGIRPADVSRYLAKQSVEDLYALATGTVSQPVWPLVFILDNVLSTAEFELLEAEGREQATVGWTTEAARPAEIGTPPPTEGESAFAGFRKALEDVVHRRETVPLERFLLGGDFPRTCYRMALLALEDQADERQIELTVELGPGRKMYSDYVSEISRGHVGPRQPSEARP